ncbi:FMN reductase [Azospira sp. I13]|uniref:flavodoxin family protein n=1 Tax=Azospira sp. I13 TaxID=1765050 RepID=UPI000D4998F3|nr:NAD(P)H-dependent oxidoreductase [Azospira sp. I13]GBG04035.1 FMN reductase [Azospira sp. I13]
MAKIAIVYHSGYGHTAKQAEAVAAGVAGVEGATAQLVALDDIAAVPWADLDAADGIIFGAPTYMGGPSAKFKEFADASSKAWFTRAWQDKVAGGFTNSASLNGDKQGTLGALTTLALQHGMIWVSLGLLPANSSKAQRNDVNRMGASFGAMAQSDSDVGPDVAPPAGDLETSRLYGARVAETTLRFVRGKR